MRTMTAVAVLIASVSFSAMAADGQMSGHDRKDPMGVQEEQPDQTKNMSGDKSMGMMQDEASEMPMMGDMMDGMGMGMSMGRRVSDIGPQKSSLPGFPGQSRLYHIGATGFFLDHPEHVTLSTEQTEALTQRKQAALERQNELTRKIDILEEELFALTAADEPDARRIEKKIEEIENVRASRRFEYIRSVGEAAHLLTDKQRAQLVGAADASGANPTKPMHEMTPMEPEEDMDSMEGEHM